LSFNLQSAICNLQSWEVFDMRLHLACLVVLAGMASGTVESDEQLLKDHKVSTDGPGLIEFFKKRAGETVSDARLAALIEQLGDDDFFKREEASRLLGLAGARARNHLKSALKHSDLEVRRRAGRILERIDSDVSSSMDLLGAAVRMLAKRKPAGAAAVLLDHLGRAENSTVVEEIRHALVALAVRDGKVEPALVAALRDKVASKRLAAAVALCRAKLTDQLPALRKLLSDPDDSVRLHVALSLALLGEKDAVGALVSFMDREPGLEMGRAEDVLFRLAKDKSPHLTGRDAESRKKYRQEWEAWWKDSKDKVDLDVLHENDRIAGHTTVLLLDDNQVLDLDAAKKVRWKIDNIQFALDLQRLSGERVLLAEHKANRVTERNSKGEVVWSRNITEPLTAQRLPNGNTLIANPEGLIEVTRAGKVVFTYTPPVGQKIMRARKLPGGDILLVVQLGTAYFVRLDRFGKEVRRYGVEVNTSGGRIDLTPAGHVLIPEIYNNRVQERDMDGKIIRTIAVPQPIAAFALPNGHVIVTSMTQKSAIEFDRSGKEVWVYRHSTRVSRAVRP
jgi:hypothetical protein